MIPVSSYICPSLPNNYIYITVLATAHSFTNRKTHPLATCQEVHTPRRSNLAAKPYSLLADAHYICSSAANAIISEIGPYRVSSDALQTINQFLDEFLVFLLSSSLSLDLSRIKAVVFTLLPSTLGKNAIVEAELEVKTFTETEAIDYDSYERMRTLGSGGPFPVHDALPLLREKCLEFCTLADKDDNISLMHQTSPAIQISPIVAIYVTTIIEHIAEYVLTAIAMTAEHEDTEFIRMKEVFLALMDDVQVGGVFYRMELREKLEVNPSHLFFMHAA